MNHPYWIRLAQPEWETLIQSLTHIDNNRQNRIDAFFNSINRDITIRHEENRTVIQSDLLDEDAILAALFASEAGRQTIGENSYSYRIACSSVLDEQDGYQATNNLAEYDGYRELLITTQLTTTSTYETQVVSGIPAAA